MNTKSFKTLKNIRALALITGIAVSSIAGVAVIPAQAALLVTPLNTTANQQTNNTAFGTTLGNSLIGTGIAATGLSYTGAGQAAGTFSGGTSAGISLDTGIILTTGKASAAIGTNNNTRAATNNITAADSNLNTLAGATTFDASALSFNFTTDTGNVFVNFVFASEEYPEYANGGFSDVFAFYIDGVNIAVVPGTTTPISINTINSGNGAASGVTPTGANSQNSSLYVSNASAIINPTGFAGLQYDGYTVGMTAQAVGLAAGSHTIKIAIADVGDADYDSAVFLQASSFASTAKPISSTAAPEPFTIVGTILGGATALRMRKKLKDSEKA
jgi:hypothetical protein